MNNNQYQLIIGSCGASSITSTPVTLTVNDPASISSQPTNASGEGAHRLDAAGNEASEVGQHAGERWKGEREQDANQMRATGAPV